MEQWKDCLAALVPFYTQQGGNATLILTDSGGVFEDQRSVKWNLRRLARLFSVDIEVSRRNQREYFHYTQGLPLPLSPGLVLVPLKTRKAVGKNDGCHSYVNPSAVLGLAEGDGGEARSVIVLPGEQRLPCHYTMKTVRKRLRDGIISLEKYGAIMLGSPSIVHVSSGDYELFLEKFIHALIGGAKKGPDDNK